MSELSNRAFHLGLQKADAWDKGRRLAEFLERIFQLSGYVGPVAIAGGYMRDLALNRTPKDLDVFLDGGCVRGLAHGQEIARSLADILGHGGHIERSLQCYGIWAKDIEHVVKVAFEGGQDQELLYIGGVPIPFSVDLVVLRRGEMAKAGYEPSVHLDQRTRHTFLFSVLKRVDLRLNAIGSSAQTTLSADHWNDDALNSRLVIQWERAEEDGTTDRIDRRVLRLQAEKYPGWSVHLEGPEGALAEC